MQFLAKIMPHNNLPLLYWEINAYMYWVKEQLCLKLFTAEADCAASDYLSSVLLESSWIMRVRTPVEAVW